MNMDSVTSGLQTVLDVLRGGVEAAMNVFGGVQNYAEAGNQVAEGTGAFAEAVKTVYNILAGLFGFAALDPAGEPDPIVVIVRNE